ncbi:hypothetical protein B0A51_15569 [Rachicladosporium sp. CCFEE 5018]|nr:hypothetical protein B0A51_15569 [Rachicladosporium sp. CCFEE 5018]
MNTPIDQHQAWSAAPDIMDPMVQMTSDLDDLSNIFNIDNFDLDAITNLDDNNGFAEVMQQSHPGTHPGTPFDEAMGGFGNVPTTTSMAQDFSGFVAAPQQQQFGMNGQGHQAGNMGFANEDLFQQGMVQDFQPLQQQQQQHFQFSTQQAYPGGSHIPPTPNSYEMHGETGRFLQQLDAQQRALMEQQYHMRKNEQIQFTPMASPQSTPQFHLAPEYTVPGAYFSPLTAPALHAQNGNGAPRSVQQQRVQQGYYTNPSTAPSSNAASPVDPNADVEMGGDGLTLPEPASQPKKSARRKVATPRSLAVSKIKQSPIAKAQKRKSGMLASITPSKSAENMVQEVQRSGSANLPHSAGFTLPPAFESSEEQSVSPEALSEALMGPPPKPGSSLSHSPALQGQQQPGAQQTPPSGKAATPKSILSMKPGCASTTGLNGLEETPLDDLQLPAAARRPTLSQIDTQVELASSEQTPRMAARKTPKLGPLDRPTSVRPGSASASPALNGMASPMTASTPAGLLKDKTASAKPSATARGAKKRGSVPASPGGLLSPALRPRISPSIKPLLPEGTLHSPTHALLLASKSNYQNLLDGTRLPGVSYPESLSTGLTSKRTSHKVAEQGRRNRINDALKEMQSLIPATPKGEGEAEVEEDVNGEGGDAEREREREGRSQSSKAATVESANKYIRVLKESEERQRMAMMEMKKELDMMRRKLGESGSESGGSGSGVEAGLGDAMDESKSPEAVKVG